MDINAYWERVKVLIKAHKITVGKFAEYIDIPRSTLYSWIQFGFSPEVGTAYNIATALGVSVEYLVTGEDGKSLKVRLEQTETRKTAGDKIKKLVGELQEETEKL